MENKKQSSLEFFAKMLVEQGLLYTNDFENLITYQESKEIHKQEIISAKMNSMTDNELSYIVAEKYYNETFGGQDNE